MARLRAAAVATHPLAGSALCDRAPEVLFEPNIVVAGYWPFRSEIDPRPLMQRFARTGARLALPRAPDKGSNDPLRFHLWRAEDVLHASAFGVHEPDPAAERAEPDILLVPLLAFDRAGGRLGYGAGHYDRTLQRLRAQKAILAIGLAFAEQEAPHVPIHAHDQRLDAILTQRAFIEIA